MWNLLSKEHIESSMPQLSHGNDKIISCVIILSQYIFLELCDGCNRIHCPRGTETIPNLLNYLAYSYIWESRVEETPVFIESLESPSILKKLGLTRGTSTNLLAPILRLFVKIK